ncbi:MAG: HAMP domain-containing histidine kinase [Alphaproteobacteria bacterium]|nr:HAMP domain-containing histidine kinase [Alphaproteobacteria bacterium]
MNADLTVTRRALPWALGLLIVGLVVGVVAVVLVLHREATGQVSVDVENDLRDRAESWEDDLIAKLVSWSEGAVSNRYQGRIYQTQLRQTAGWFDSLYLWTPAQRVTNQNRNILVPGRFAYPEEPRVEHEAAMERIECLSRARLYASQADTTPEEAVQAWRTWCRAMDGSVRLMALSEAVNVYRRMGEWDELLEMLDQEGLPQQATLTDAANLGVPPFRAAVLNLQRAEALLNLQRDDEAGALYFRTGMEIADLDGPDAEVLMHLLAYPLLPRVQAWGNPQRTHMLEAAALRATRRVNGFREVRDQLLPRRVPMVPEAPRFIRDQYGDTPFLLFTHWAANGEAGVALQLDQDELLKDFLNHMGRYRQYLVITDSTGREYITGARAGGEIAVSVPFSRALTHLRVGLRSAPIDEQIHRMDSALAFLLGVLGVLLMVALAMLYGIIAANRTQRLLLQRQKEFATRVTHELKTPLAGIKVMAENLELGHYGSDRERAGMARAIVREADNLTLRVNEILSVTRERQLRRPEPFDPEEPLFEAVDLWGPRLEVAGIGFEADLQPTSEVMGDAEALRDAVACLLDNALKYRREDVDAQVWLAAEQIGDRVVISVTDNGLGVPAEMRDSVFERFVRVEGDNRGKSGGHGLGLAQVAEIVRGHGGTVRCEEGAEGGARFVIELPAMEA